MWTTKPGRNAHCSDSREFEQFGGTRRGEGGISTREYCVDAPYQETQKMNSTRLRQTLSARQTENSVPKIRIGIM